MSTFEQAEAVIVDVTSKHTNTGLPFGLVWPSQVITVAVLSTATSGQVDRKRWCVTVFASRSAILLITLTAPTGVITGGQNR